MPARIRRLAMTMVGACLCGGLAHGSAAETESPPAALDLSPGVLGLLRAEMVQIAAGIQGIGLALATADWSAISRTSENIRASYLLERDLSPPQAEELERALPAEFKRLDAEFHRRAEKLGAAAAQHDAEGVAFHYARLLEACAQCHAAFAPARFPGFGRVPPPVHEHAPQPTHPHGPGHE